MKASKGTKHHTKPKSPGPAAASPSCGCGKGPSACTCGKALCFQRPNFFCGQLLNDGDLSGGQTYFREKLKLYHRTLHGSGVVCGLRLICDPDCDGHIRIGEGFAIDDCGNDLVVCEPASFDVIAALRTKNFLVPDEPPDECDEEKPPGCKVKQCFYVTICYDEEPAEYTTPFKANCGPGAAACEPTRIKETVRFDVLDCPPRPKNYLDDLEERIACCWSIFTDGPLARALKDFFEQHEGGGVRDYCQIFCQLKVLFKHHLKKCPDQYDCTLWQQVCDLECPEDKVRDYEGYRESFCKLFELIQRYAYDCILGELIFSCAKPPQASCVGLGTVEVEDGKVLRVCNCPRTYVWSFAHFFEVLLATVGAGAACDPHCCGKSHKSDKVVVDRVERAERDDHAHREPHRKDGRVCCATFDFDCNQFQALFRAKPHYGRLAAAAPVRAIRHVVEALKHGFNFTDAFAYSPEIYKGMTSPQAEAFAQHLTGKESGNLIGSVEMKHIEAADPIAALFAQLLRRPGDPLFVAQSRDGIIERLVPGSQLPGAKSGDEAELGTKVIAAVAELTKHGQARDEEIKTLKEQVASILAKMPPPANPPA